jgi:hypothetical protein
MFVDSQALSDDKNEHQRHSAKKLKARPSVD